VNGKGGHDHCKPITHGSESEETVCCVTPISKVKATHKSNVPKVGRLQCVDRNNTIGTCLPSCPSPMLTLSPSTLASTSCRSGSVCCQASNNPSAKKTKPMTAKVVSAMIASIGAHCDDKASRQGVCQAKCNTSQGYHEATTLGTLPCPKSEKCCIKATAQITAAISKSNAPPCTDSADVRGVCQRSCLASAGLENAVGYRSKTRHCPSNTKCCVPRVKLPPSVPQKKWTRADCLAVAHAWLNAGIRYSWEPQTHQYAHSGGKGPYRPDCSGFVSAAWDYPPPGYVVDTMQGHSIKASQLRTCDALRHEGEGGNGHIVLFIGWAENGAIWVVEECGHMSECCGSSATCPGKCGGAYSCDEYCNGCPIQWHKWSGLNGFAPLRRSGW